MGKKPLWGPSRTHTCGGHTLSRMAALGERLRCPGDELGNEHRGRPTTLLNKTVSSARGTESSTEWCPETSFQPGQEIPRNQLPRFPPIKSMEFPFIKLFPNKGCPR